MSDHCWFLLELCETGAETPWEGRVLGTPHLWRASQGGAHVAGVLGPGSCGTQAQAVSCGYRAPLFPQQVLEERQRLWLSELKRLYVERLHEVAQKAERSERNLQLQLFVAQQEQRRLRKELRAQQGLAPEPRPPEADPNISPEEEARWEVRDQVLKTSPVPVSVVPSSAHPSQLTPLTLLCLALAHPVLLSRCARRQQRLAS